LARGELLAARTANAWAHAAGNGFSIQLEMVPLDGRVALRVTAKKHRANSRGIG
jgi:hypothetical protein